MVDQRLQSLLQPSVSPTWIAENHQAAAAEAVRSLEKNGTGPSFSALR